MITLTIKKWISKKKEHSPFFQNRIHLLFLSLNFRLQASRPLYPSGAGLPGVGSSMPVSAAPWTLKPDPVELEREKEREREREKERERVRDRERARREEKQRRLLAQQQQAASQQVMRVVSVTQRGQEN